MPKPLKKQKERRKPFHNRYGYIKLGTKVRFEMENNNLWGGDIVGILSYDEETKEYFIDTKNSGRIEIDKYLSAYWNTIRPHHS